MIKPTIGRIVWYWPSGAESSICSGGTQPLPAIVCHVWTDSCINIAGFDANGSPFNRTSVLLISDEMVRPSCQFAEWMPYQKNQAEKSLVAAS